MASMAAWAGSILALIAIGVAVNAAKMHFHVERDIILYGTAAIRSDGNLILNCTASSNEPHMIAVNWTRVKKDDEIEILGDDLVTTNITNGRLLSVYKSKEKAKPKDAGNYTCVFFKKGTETLLNGTIFPVKSAPHPTEHSNVHRLREQNSAYYRVSKSAEGTIGQDGEVKLHCNTDGFPIPKIKWYRVKHGLEDEDALFNLTMNVTMFHIDPSRANITDQQDLKLAISNITDRGFYVCVSENGIDPPMYVFTLLRIKDKLAPLWPFLTLVGEFVLLGLIIGLCELRRKRLAKDEDDYASKSASGTNASTSGANSEVRQRSSGKSAN